MKAPSLCLSLLVTLSLQLSSAWLAPTTTRRTTSALYSKSTEDDNSQQQPRRQVLQTLSAALLLPSALPANAEVQRAVGGAEIDCRSQGNCLELGQLDGAVGWNWGSKDRCDPTDPRCGPDGKLGDLPAGKSVPEVTNKITHLAEIVVDIGREETVRLHLGLYGDDCPASVKQMLLFLTAGITTTSKLAFENGMGVLSSPVSLLQGGKIPNIVPYKLIDFGVPEQSAAYARARGMRSAGDDFIPQPRPNPDDTKGDAFVRKHDVAGLISVPAKGLGYGGSGFESDDAAYESCFQITADEIASLDKANRRVIGQLIDEESMASLARLASLATKKGIKGVIPGQSSGPPLLKVSIRDVEAKKVPQS